MRSQLVDAKWSGWDLIRLISEMQEGVNVMNHEAETLDGMSSSI